MLALADRWCDLSSSVRLASWLLMLLLASVVCGFYSRGAQPPEEHVNLQSQWLKITPLLHSEGDLPAEQTAPFSAVDFQRSLVSWQPSGEGGELVLQNDWPTLLGAFDLLARRNMAIKGFTLLPEKERLRLTLQLEAIRDE